MTGYIISILGVVIAGVIIDIIVPSGSINKYIKGIFSIFVVAALISPIVKFVNNFKGVDLKTSQIEIDQKLLNFIYKSQIINKENAIEAELETFFCDNIDINLQYTIESNDLRIDSCLVIFKNQSNKLDNQHIDIYEKIYEVVNKHTGLAEKEIIYE